MRLSNWDEYLKKLEDEDSEYNKDIKAYLENLKKLSEITFNVEKCEVQNYIEKIVNFINAYKHKQEIEKIVGFRVERNLEGRDYYFYIADQKMKASVYFLRYLNFINKMEKIENNEFDKIEKNIENDLEKIKDSADGYLEYEEKMEGLLKKQSENLAYMNYMMFDNMMHEIKFIGGVYQFMWHWTKKEVNLYRYASYDATTPFENNTNCNKRDYMQKMFDNVINHMNKSSKILQSYSENPYIDIYKYLKISKKDLIEWKIEDDNFEIIFEEFNNTISESTFEMIKNANINCIKTENECYESFYEFAQDSTEWNNTSYSIELYPTVFKGEKNDKGTTKNIKKYLGAYLKSWGATEEQLMSYVADDKEVVVLGEIARESVDISEENIPIEIATNMKCRVHLKKKDIINLILKIGNEKSKYSIEKVIDNLKIDYYSQSYYAKLADIIVRAMNDQTDLSLNGKISVNDKVINFKVKLKSNYFNLEKFETKNDDGIKEYISGKKAEELVAKDLNTVLTKSLKSRYEQYCTDNKIVNFIWNFIQNEEYPDYINTYNEFEFINNDPEIVLLKEIIFKGGKNR